MLALGCMVAPAFVAPAVQPARCNVVMQMQRPPIDDARRNRSPGLQNNFYDQPIDNFKRPYGGGGGGRQMDRRYPGRAPGQGDRYYTPPFQRPGPSVGPPVLPPTGGFDRRQFRGGSQPGFDPGFDRSLQRRDDYRRYGQPGPDYYDRRFDGGIGYVGNTLLDLASFAGIAALGYALLTVPKVPNSQGVAELLGLICIASGCSLSVSGVLDKGSQNNLFRGDRGPLMTDGVYALCRHPIYAGFIAASIGLGLLSATPQKILSRILLTGALSFLLWYKADREEAELEQDFGMEFIDYARSVPPFFPSIGALWEDVRFRGSESALGSLSTTGVIVAIFSYFVFVPGSLPK